MGSEFQPRASHGSGRAREVVIDDQDESDDIRIISQQIIDKKAFVWAFGKNKDGEIGIGSQRDAFLPRPIFG